MKVVVIGESSGATMEQIMTVYPRHKAVVDQFVAKGEVIGIGFVRRDPFALEGLVKSYVIRDWQDTMLA